MKKNIVKLFLPAALILSLSAPVFANTDLVSDDRDYEEPVTISYDFNEDDDILSNETESHREIIDAADKYFIENHTVKDITSAEGVYSILTHSEKNRDSVYYTVTEDTPVYSLQGNEFIHPRNIDINAEIIVIYDVNTPMALSEPARLTPQAILITSDDADQNEYKIDYFDRTGLSRDGSLKLNVSENTEIIHSNSLDIDNESVLDNYLLVIYRNTTRSMPPQTNPGTIIMLTEYEQNVVPGEGGTTVTTPSQPEEEIEEEESEDEELTLAELLKDLEAEHKYEQGYENAYAVRPIAEKLGYNVHWDEETQTVTLNKEGSTILLRIGVIQYSRDNAAHTLDKAPFIRNEHTFVEIDFIESLIH